MKYNKIIAIACEFWVDFLAEFRITQIITMNNDLI